MPIPITAAGAERLKAELQRLKAVERPAIIQAIKEAREKGDLSENAEYEAARERQGFIEGRIMELEGKIGALQVIDPASVDSGGRIVFGATVLLEDLGAGEHVKYQIVGDDEADARAGLISVSSPIARALIGRSEGDVIEFLAPGGRREYEVLEVRYLSRDPGGPEQRTGRPFCGYQLAGRVMRCAGQRRSRRGLGDPIRTGIGRSLRPRSWCTPGWASGCVDGVMRPAALRRPASCAPGRGR
jgi:transcription elongation factor GreA